ncbi:hypothetical protein DP113_00730 [Brasilonema octagenarum UFV-E1]|uniref:Uncharacterized protein n=2 Tax=Brasilonema TaxID=383614 RepID=A0A856MA48_9CYAN|nr:hypothetical protein [Brasilonema octagenarum UFV-OR1]QDL06631.1 hypothetical protein DP114_00740 [Brasilonema sennae CENA114]QDL12999.1 hypothetical protein DP113_00730 [Brasilonema octagenarum UFV-E1]
MDQFNTSGATSDSKFARAKLNSVDQYSSDRNPCPNNCDRPRRAPYAPTKRSLVAPNRRFGERGFGKTPLGKERRAIALYRASVVLAVAL